MLKSAVNWSRRNATASTFKRFQSSSKKDWNINNANPVLPKIKTTKAPTTNNDISSAPKKVISSTPSVTLKPDVKPKQGFTSLPKVPSTYNFNPKELLLDSFFNGYRPMTLPITPPKKQPRMAPRLPQSLNKNGGAFVYFEIDDNLDFIDDFKDEMNPNMNHTIQDIERQTSTRFDHSHKSLREEDIKKEEQERDIYETKLELAKEEDLVSDNNTSNFVESKRFRGRRKLQYKRRSGKK